MKKATLVLTFIMALVLLSALTSCTFFKKLMDNRRNEEEKEFTYDDYCYYLKRAVKRSVRAEYYSFTSTEIRTSLDVTFYTEESIKESGKGKVVSHLSEIKSNGETRSRTEKQEYYVFEKQNNYNGSYFKAETVGSGFYVQSISKKEFEQQNLSRYLRVQEPEDLDTGDFLQRLYLGNGRYELNVGRFSKSRSDVDGKDVLILSYNEGNDGQFIDITITNDLITNVDVRFVPNKGEGDSRIREEGPIDSDISSPKDNLTFTYHSQVDYKRHPIEYPEQFLTALTQMKEGMPYSSRQSFLNFVEVISMACDISEYGCRVETVEGQNRVTEVIKGDVLYRYGEIDGEEVETYYCKREDEYFVLEKENDVWTEREIDLERYSAVVPIVKNSLTKLFYDPAEGIEWTENLDKTVSVFYFCALFWLFDFSDQKNVSDIESRIVSNTFEGVMNNTKGDDSAIVAAGMQVIEDGKTTEEAGFIVFNSEKPSFQCVRGVSSEGNGETVIMTVTVEVGVETIILPEQIGR